MQRPIIRVELPAQPDISTIEPHRHSIQGCRERSPRPPKLKMARRSGCARAAGRCILKSHLQEFSDAVARRLVPPCRRAVRAPGPTKDEARSSGDPPRRNRGPTRRVCARRSRHLAVPSTHFEVARRLLCGSVSAGHARKRALDFPSTRSFVVPRRIYRVTCAPARQCDTKTRLKPSARSRRLCALSAGYQSSRSHRYLSIELSSIHAQHLGITGSVQLHSNDSLRERSDGS